ncbi:CmlA/FloR family chloramphenicol efflux MFS transporter [Phyllobacterium myrsinacearum]|uniref:Bcr/CflA family efflux transporter n=1 Tax=Phyllobacterium myrsinacearum TaxID=28101 RepID=A0A839EHK4_9HYPH|nr:CmlA/FloR family chloramphenicol efflux MFS transporter [Phyllobacterium myrsinacearum]MBA8878372.1 DHA1 family florfenicol/chloramphenicol resistance protein-like MFS transporter [Phyllobacterium myrsinacearum]
MLHPKNWAYSLPAALLLMAPFDLLASLGMDIYLPVVTRMPVVLDTTPAVIQLTLSLYMIVLGCGQLLFGPLADRIGRRPVVLGGAVLFGLASAGLAMTRSAEVFIVLRVLQSAGGAAALVATFATVRDVYAERPEGAIIYGLFGSMLAFVPAFAPMIGALVDHAFGWRGIFWLLAGLAALSGLHAFLRWPETLPAQTRSVTLRRSFVRVLSSAAFWTYTLGFSTAMGTFFVYFSTAPRILMQELGFSSTTFSLVFATVALVMIVCSRFGGVFVRHWGQRGCLIRGMALFLAGGALLAMGQIFLPTSVVTFMAPMWVMACAISLTCAVAANGALRDFGDIAGTATAIYYFIQSVIVAVAGTLAVVLLAPASFWPIAVFATVAAGITLGMMSLSSRDEKGVTP